MDRYYAGIGSRETPDDVLFTMRAAAKVLGRKGYILRSGGANGADQAFEFGSPFNRKEIFTAKHATIEAEAIAEKIHPAWSHCNEYARKLHARNVMQIMGHDLNHHVTFVVCWTKDGKDIGGTRTAIVLARSLSIPVYNLALKEQVEGFATLLESL